MPTNARVSAKSVAIVLFDPRASTSTATSTNARDDAEFDGCRIPVGLTASQKHESGMQLAARAVIDSQKCQVKIVSGKLRFRNDVCSKTRGVT